MVGEELGSWLGQLGHGGLHGTAWAGCDSWEATSTGSLPLWVTTPIEAHQHWQPNTPQVPTTPRFPLLLCSHHPKTSGAREAEAWDGALPAWLFHLAHIPR